MTGTALRLSRSFSEGPGKRNPWQVWAQGHENPCATFHVLRICATSRNLLLASHLSQRSRYSILFFFFFIVAKLLNDPLHCQKSTLFVDEKSMKVLLTRAIMTLYIPLHLQNGEAEFLHPD